MKVLVFGGGSVGLGLLSCLHKSGTPVSVIARSDTSLLLCKSGLLRSGIFGTHQIPPGEIGIYEKAEEISNWDFDFVLICVKAFDTEEAALELSQNESFSDSKSRIVLCQNGYGNFEIFRRYFGPERLFLARVITGFCRPEKNRVEITVHAAPIRMGSPIAALSGETAALCRAISCGGIPAEVSQTVEKDIWAKILYNCLLNPLGAVLGVPYGVLGESVHTRGIMHGVAEEAFAVMARAGFSTYWTTAEEFLDAFYSSMLPPTAAHESSMLQDIRAGRRTEIDALNGAISKLGRDYGVSTPLNDTLTAQIKFLEK